MQLARISTTSANSSSFCFCQSLSDSIPSLFFGQHNIETSKVVQLSSLLSSCSLGSPRRLVPFFDDSLFFQLLLDNAGTSGTRELCEADRSQGEMFVLITLARNICSWTINYSLAEGKNTTQKTSGGDDITRLWSMISVMTAIWPAEGPDLRRTTIEIGCE